MIRIFGPANTNGLRRSRRVLRTPDLRDQFAQRLADMREAGKIEESEAFFNKAYKKMSFKNRKFFTLAFCSAMAQHGVNKLSKAIEIAEETHKALNKNLL